MNCWTPVLIVFCIFFIIIPTSKQDLDGALGQNGRKTHWNIKDDSQGYKGRYELSYRVLFSSKSPLSDERGLNCYGLSCDLHTTLTTGEGI